MTLQYLNKINPLAFLLAFSIGILYVYATQPSPKIIIKHPTPQNAGKIIYEDKANNCYKYLAEEVQCPDDSNMIVNHPLVLG